MTGISCPKSSQPRDSYRWVIFGIIASIYFFAFFHRVSISVIAPDLLATFQTHATALGLMSSMYFYVYALEQPLVGYLSDLLGPRRVVGLWSVAAALGCVLFGLAPTIGWAAVGRALIGFGVGGVFIPGMKAFSHWFREGEFSTMTGLLLASGNLGAIVATTPLAWMADRWGWRLSFLIIGGISLLLALASFFLIRDHKKTLHSEGEEPPSGNQQTTAPQGSALQVLTSLRFWILAAVFCGPFGAYLTVQGLWATPFLMSALKLDRLNASELNMLLPVGFIFGATLCGWLADRVFGNKVYLFIFLLITQTGMWAILTLWGHVLGTRGMIPVFLLLGGASGGLGIIIWALVRDTTPSSILGLTTGLINPSPFLGVAVLQVWTGAILDRVGQVNGMYPPAAYRDIFLLCMLIGAGCLALSVYLRKHLALKEKGDAMISR